MVDDLLSFGPFLSLSQEDPTLIEMVEGLGTKFRVKARRELGFLTVKKAGVEFRFQKESWLADETAPLKGPYILTEVGVYSEGYDHFHQYPGKLVKGITFASTRDEVREAFGTPVKSGGGNRFGTIVFPEWDRYQVRKKYYVEFSYDAETKRVTEVSMNLVRLAKP